MFIIIIIIIITWVFLTSTLADVAGVWVTTSPSVSRTLSILADFSNAVLWIVAFCPLISKSSSPFINPLMTVPRAPITIGITVVFMFHGFFNSFARSRYLSFFSFSFNVVSWDSKVHNSASSLFLLIIIRSGHLAEIRWSISISKSQESLCVLFSWSDSGLCIYNLFVWSSFSFLHNSRGITFPT